MTHRTILELAAFQAVWLACALGAAHGRSAPGIVAAGIYVGAQLACSGSRPMMIATTLASGAAGLVLETLLGRGELLAYSAHWPDGRMAPAWIVALWLAFGSTIPTTARLLGSRPFTMAAILGALSGPLAYAAGAKLGALQLVAPAWIGIAALACSWGVLLPVLVSIARIERAKAQAGVR